MVEKFDLVHRLEIEVDRCGVRNVVAALALVCAGKAEHVAVNWQDTATAKVWDKWATHLDRAAAFKQPDPLKP